MTDQLFAKETLPISLEEEIRRSYLDYAMSIIVGRTRACDSILYMQDCILDKATLLARILQHVVHKALAKAEEMRKSKESGLRYCTNFLDVSKPSLALLIPLGIRAPPGQQYSPEENAPEGAFCIYRLKSRQEPHQSATAIAYF